MTHCRQIMLEELQRRNFAPTTISSAISTPSSNSPGTSSRPPDRLNQTHLRIVPGVSAARAEDAPADRAAPRRGVAFFFVKTLKRRYLLDDTPYPKAPRRLPQILSVEEVARLIDAADSLSHRTMLMVLYSTGMRNAELRQLQVARHRQPSDADSHPTTGRAAAIATCRSARRCSRRCACTTGGCGRRRGCFRAPSAAGAPTSRSRRRSLWDACRRRGRARRARQALLAASAAPFVRHAPAGERGGPPDDSATRSGTRRSGTRCCISISRRSTCRPSPIRWMP